MTDRCQTIIDEARPLRGYMVSGDPAEGAALVFAHSAKDAKRMAWRLPVWDWMTADQYTDVRVRWLRQCDPKAWGVDAPCVIDSPQACAECERWHDIPVGPDGLCEDCREDRPRPTSAVRLYTADQIREAVERVRASTDFLRGHSLESDLVRAGVDSFADALLSNLLGDT